MIHLSAMFKGIGTVFLLLCMSLVLVVCKKTPTAPDVPDIPNKYNLLIYCYSLQGTLVGDARVSIDNQTYDTSGGQVSVTLESMWYNIDFISDAVWDAWLFVRDNLSGANIDQKDAVDRNAEIFLSSGKTLYLIKIPKSWDMDTISPYLGGNFGMFKLKPTSYPGTIPVVVHKEYSGDTSEAERVLDSNLTQMNNSQNMGSFDIRIRFERQATESDPKIDVRLKEGKGIYDASHREHLSGYFITNSDIRLPGQAEFVHFSVTLEELFEGITHQSNDDLFIALLFGNFRTSEVYNELAKQVMMVWAHSSPGMKFLGGTSVVLNVPGRQR